MKTIDSENSGSRTGSKDLYKKKLTSLGEEFLTYQNLAAEAHEKGNEKLADRWKLAARLIMSFVRYLDSSHEISFIKEFSQETLMNNRVVEAQEIAQYTSSSLAALMNNNPSLAKQLSGYADETKEAGIRCRHWLALIKEEIANHNNFKKINLDESAQEYRANSLKATQAGKEIIAQHWAEAACLMQEASRKKGLSIGAYVTSGNEILSTYWDLSRDASYEAAKIKVQVALACEQGNKDLAEEYDRLALLAEKLSCYRENLVRSMINGEVELISHWRNASEFLTKSLEAAHSLISFSDDNNLFSFKKMIAITAEQAAESHCEVIAKLQKKKNTSLASIVFAKKSYEEAVLALQFFEKNNLPIAIQSQKQVALYSKAYQLSKKAAQAKTKWYTLGIPFLYWKYQVKKIERALKNN